MMAFRVGGALECLQEQYFLLNLCFSMVTFDLQAQVHARSPFVFYSGNFWHFTRAACRPACRPARRPARAPRHMLFFLGVQRPTVR